MHRDCETLEKTRLSVVRGGGLFAAQVAKRDEGALLAMKVLFFLVKENIALEKWNNLKGNLSNPCLLKFGLSFFLC